MTHFLEPGGDTSPTESGGSWTLLVFGPWFLVLVGFGSLLVPFLLLVGSYWSWSLLVLFVLGPSWYLGLWAHALPPRGFAPSARPTPLWNRGEQLSRENHQPLQSKGWPDTNTNPNFT